MKGGQVVLCGGCVMCMASNCIFSPLENKPKTTTSWEFFYNTLFVCQSVCLSVCQYNNPAIFLFTYILHGSVCQCTVFRQLTTYSTCKHSWAHFR